MICKSNDLWVFVELKENGEIDNSGLELLNPGGRIAKGLNGKLVAVLFGNRMERAIESLAEFGVDQIIITEGEEYEEYSTDVYAATLTKLLEKYAPTGVLIAATENGRDMSPRVACRLKTGLTADCISVGIDEETGCLLWTRPTLGGNLMACILCQNHWPQMGTIRPGVYRKEKSVKSSVEIIRENTLGIKVRNRTRVYETICEDEGSQELENAEIIIAGGRGIGGGQGFQILKELAEELGAAVGATRGAVEKGWISHAYQIGQTGRTVQPKLYIACGISGAIQHTVGMASSEIVIAINQDRNAPIFQTADYGIVGDVEIILPALIKEIRKRGKSYYA